MLQEEQRIGRGRALDHPPRLHHALVTSSFPHAPDARNHAKEEWLRRLSHSILAALCTQFGAASKIFAAAPNSVLLAWEASPTAIESARLGRSAELGAHHILHSTPERPGLYTIVKPGSRGAVRGAIGRDAVAAEVVDLHPGQEYTFVVQYGQTTDGTNWTWSALSDSVTYLVPPGGPIPAAEPRAFGLTAVDMGALVPLEDILLGELRIAVIPQQGGMLIQVLGAPGQCFVLQYSEGVDGSGDWHWRNLDGLNGKMLPVDGKYAFFDPVPRALVTTQTYDQNGQLISREEEVLHPFRFYRLVAVPPSAVAHGE